MRSGEHYIMLITWWNFVAFVSLSFQIQLSSAFSTLTDYKESSSTTTISSTIVHSGSCSCIAVEKEQSGRLLWCASTTRIHRRAPTGTLLQREFFCNEGKTLLLQHLNLTGIFRGGFSTDLKALTTLDLQGNQLRSWLSVRTASLQNLRKLVLWQNRLSVLGRGFLAGMTSLRYLDLEENQIRRIGRRDLTDETTDRCTRPQFLETLFLDKNQIEWMEPGAFRCLPRLLFLGVTKNQLTRLPYFQFQGLTSLKKLKLFGNKITEVHPKAFAECCQKLSHLSLVDNQLHALSDSLLADLPALEELLLDRNPLLVLPAGLFRMSPPGSGSPLLFQAKRCLVTHLDPAALAGGKRLTTLDLFDNQIVHLQSGVFRDLTQTTNLGLRRNKIRKLQSGSFDGLGRLLYLVLSDNSISEIEDDVFMPLAFLDTLTLEGNELSQLRPRTFAGLNTTFSLTLSDNRLVTLNSQVFAPLYHLQYLYLQRNRIEEVRQDAFSGLSMLKKLDLSHNQISRLHADSFADTHQLVSLDLGSNRLQVLCAFALRGLERTLRVLKLQYNRITHISPALFQNLQLLEVLSLRGNQLTQLMFSPLNSIVAPLPALSELDLSENLKLSIDHLEGVFCQTPQLVRLHINLPSEWAGNNISQTQQDIIGRVLAGLSQHVVVLSSELEMTGRDAAPCLPHQIPLAQGHWSTEQQNISSVALHSAEMSCVASEQQVMAADIAAASQPAHYSEQLVVSDAMLHRKLHLLYGITACLATALLLLAALLTALHLGKKVGIGGIDRVNGISGFNMKLLHPSPSVEESLADRHDSDSFSLQIVRGI